ncbi:MAG: DNA polymerase III subunit gamma/tau, partial [Pseudonocardiaceae bacterium]
SRSVPPATQPPATQPPATQPPATQPPATQPPATQPPVTRSPVTQSLAPEEQRNAAPEQLDAAAVRRVWPALLEAVRQQSRTTQVLLSNATASAVQGSTLVLSLPNAPLARRLGDDRNVELIRAALRTVLGVDWQVRCEHVSGEAGLPSAQPQPQKPTPQTRSPERPVSRRLAAQPPDDEVSPPPDPPPDDDEAMLAEAAGLRQEHSIPRDPEEVAVELLAEQLGARRIDS